MYGDSHALSSDSSSIFSSTENPSFFSKKREQGFPLMESNSQNNSGLLRFRSAPSSFLENFLEKSERLNSGFCPPNEEIHSNEKGSVNRFSAINSQLPPQYPRQNSSKLGSVGVDGGGYRFPGSNTGMDQQDRGRSGSSLMRQNSSPAGLFSHLASQNGYATRRGIGNYRMAADGTNGSEVSPSSSRLKNQTNFSSSLGMLSRITEVENENGGPIPSPTNGPDETRVGNSSGGEDNLFYGSGFPFTSWNDPSAFAENFSTSGIKREIMDTDENLFFDPQNGEIGNRPQILSRHSSLPNTSSEIGAIEKMLQFQDTVPCKIRAKRGCATHPRSIAERLRRTRISERMRKLQELVPNMEKQTNTSDMLDLAVEYIKTLQKQYKTLTENRANCKCSAFQNTVLNQ